jgi:DNA-binding CsgD family transcriptional regulator
VATFTWPLTTLRAADSGTRRGLLGDSTGASATRAAWLDLPAGADRRYGDVRRNARDAESAKAAVQSCAPYPSATVDQLLTFHIRRALSTDDGTALLSLAQEYRKFGWRVQLAFALEEAAVCLARAGDIDAARGAYLEAIGVYAGLGAAWDMRRMDARLRPHGVRRGPQSIHRRAIRGWAALTPSESRIADLVAQGLSNRDIAAKLFVSGRPIQTHVSSILNKLQLRSPAELAGEAVRQAVARSSR